MLVLLRNVGYLNHSRMTAAIVGISSWCNSYKLGSKNDWWHSTSSWDNLGLAFFKCCEIYVNVMHGKTKKENTLTFNVYNRVFKNHVSPYMSVSQDILHS
jgi:hypothetical protein